jgi:multiple sugar transport system permease protein
MSAAVAPIPMAASSAEVQRSRRRLRRKHFTASALTYIGVGIFVIFAVFPVYWMFITTFKQNADLYNLDGNPFWFNMPATWDNMNLLLQKTNFVRWCINTLEIAVLVVAITLLVAIPAGYAFARLRFRGSNTLGIGIFLTYLVPPTLLFLPLSRVVTTLHLQDTIWSLVVIYPTFTIPFCTWLLMGFFKSVPKEIEEAARVDGCGRGLAVMKVVLPISLPGIFSVVIFAFTLAMQDFVYALTFISPSDQKPVTLGVVSDLIRGDEFFWGSLMAGALIVAIPVTIAYNFFLDHFVQGITGGAIK